MANAREIQGRMKSIKDTMKIANAMYMVSSSKLQRARRELKNTQPYFYLIQDSLAKILDTRPEAGNEFFDTRENKAEGNKTVGVFVITGDKGLAGSYNHNVIKAVEKIAKDNEGKEHKLFVVGQTGRRYFEQKNVPVDIHFNYTAQNPTVHRAREIAGKLAELFLQGEIDEVYAVYTEMINSMAVQTTTKKILPLTRSAFKKQDNELVDAYDKATFLPDAKSAFNHIVPNYLTGFIYGALVESYCSEHNARMMAMQTATDSAKEMIKDLSIQYNRARQAAITQEITEVVGGANAKKK